MEISIVIGMICAFLLGAYIRKPFFIPKRKPKEDIPEVIEDEKVKKKIESWNKLLDYTGGGEE